MPAGNFCRHLVYIHVSEQYNMSFILENGFSGISTPCTDTLLRDSGLGRTVPDKQKSSRRSNLFVCKHFSCSWRSKKAMSHAGHAVLHLFPPKCIHKSIPAFPTAIKKVEYPLLLPAVRPVIAVSSGQNRSCGDSPVYLRSPDSRPDNGDDPSDPRTCIRCPAAPSPAQKF